MSTIFSIPGFQVGEVFAQAPNAASWAFDAWKIEDLRKDADGSGIMVAVLDTGCDLKHPEFASGQIVDARNFTGGRSDDVTDVQGHGTHCAGTIFGMSKYIGVTKGPGIVGKVLGNNGSGGDRGIAQGIDWATERGAKIISMSLGSSSPSPTIQAACKRAAAKGVLVIAAAGNEGQAGVGYPGGYDECISVAAVDRNFKVAPFSSRGVKLDTSGPGVNITSAWPGGSYRDLSGTSMATPFVAGIFCLVRAKYEAAGIEFPDTAGVRQMLFSRSVDLGKPGDDNDYGPGWANPLLLAVGARRDPAPIAGKTSEG